MGIKNYFNQLKHYANIPSLSLDMEAPVYVNTSVSHQNSSAEISSIKNYTNTHVSLGNHEKKKLYANVSKVSFDTSNERKQSSSTTPSFKTITGENVSSFDENNDSRMYENVKIRSKSSISNNTTPSSSSSHFYINLKHDEDKSVIIPTCTISLTQIDPTEDISLSSVHLIELKQVDIETNVLEKSLKSSSKAKQTLKKSEVNMTPNCHDKSNLYRSKIPSTITRILPTLRQRRTLHRPRRYRQRSSTHFRTLNHSNSTRRQQHRSSSMHSNNRQKFVSNQLYNEIQPNISSDNQSVKSLYTDERFESPVQFHGISQHEVVSWYPTDDEFISDNQESIYEDDLKNDDDKFYTHKTFEDFILRRRPISSCSTSRTVINPLLSEPIPSLSSNSHLAGITLSLDKKDVDFIHDIIHRTQGDQRGTNRITALREAYIRAINKRKDLLRTKQFSHLNEKKVQKKKSLIASKIRDELEKYDELPVYQRASLDEDDEDEDETYSLNDQHRYYHRRLPPLPSKRGRIISFVTTLKQQLQKNFHDIRSRILIELMANPSRHRPPSHNSSGLSRRYKSRSKSARYYTNSHHSVEHSYPFYRNQSSRSHQQHSNRSSTPSYHHLSSNQRFSHRPRTFRVTPDVPQRQNVK